MKKIILISLLSYILFMTGVVLSAYFFSESTHILEKIEFQDATCTEDGNIEYWQCKGCGKKYSDEVGQNEITETVIPASHKLTKTDYKAATCTENGNIEYWQCSVCNDKFSDEAGQNGITETVIPASHKLTKTDYKAETCTENGNIEYWQCTVCHDKFSDEAGQNGITETVIPASHKLTKTDYKAETCTENGNLEFWQCKLCNDKFSDEQGQNEITEMVIPAGHKLTKTDYKAETCTENGNIEYWQCTVCNNKYSDEEGQNGITETVIPAGHKLTKTDYKAETCTENGNIEYWQCTACSKKFSDEAGQNGITETEISAAHKYGEFVYDYTEKQYKRECSECGNFEYEAAGNEKFPLLARNETELADAVDNAEQNAFIKLANDITVTTGEFAVITRLPENGTLDLGGYTVTVKYNGGFVVEGTNVTLQNGKVITDFADQSLGYSLFVGDEGENNFVTVKNIETDGGINVYNCEATLIDCKVNAAERKYYALWADAHSTITVESGEYYGGELACIHSTADADPEGCGYIVINGGSFSGKIIATYCTTVNGGNFDGDIILTYYNGVHAKLVVKKEVAEGLNIVSGSDKYQIVETVDDNGNLVYETNEIS